MKMPPLRFLEGLKHQGHSEGTTRTRGQRLWHKSTPLGEDKSASSTRISG